MKSMVKKYIKRGILLSVIHLVITFSLFFWSFNKTMEAFDNPYTEVSLIYSVIEPAITLMVNILMQPCLSVWTPWMSKHMPDLIEWVLVLLNSALWGFVLSAFWELINRRSKRRQMHKHKVLD